ncbi:MAG: NAD(P)H-hydrate dehydratase [Pseudomonadota bacterium]
MNRTHVLEQSIYTGAAVAAIDKNAIENYAVASDALMHEAGEAAFNFAVQTFSGCKRWLVLCGKGNNGGDGYVLATLAKQHGLDVAVYCTDPPRGTDAINAREAYLSSGGKILNEMPEQIDPGYLIVDALLGTGLSSAPRGETEAVIRWANEQNCARFAVDISSGVNGDNGDVPGSAFNADQTLTFIAHKLGLLTGAAGNHVGVLSLWPLDMPAQAILDINPCGQILRQPILPSRLADSHKGSYGHVAVVGANRGMLGAGILASRAALRVGAGKVTLVGHVSNLDKAALLQPEVMSADYADLERISDMASVIAIGPGLALSEDSRDVFTAMMEQELPTVVDADALTLLASQPRRDRGHMVLTPHPGEAATLLKTNTAAIQSNRLQAAEEIAKQYQAVCVLKGFGTVVASNNNQSAICTLGNPGMASAGMGDVLTGIVVGLLAQGLSCWDAACAGVWLHSHAADIAAGRVGERSLLASDVITVLEKVNF